jgi:hypothetical protein
MRKVWNHLDRYRVDHPITKYKSRSGDRYGYFEIPYLPPELSAKSNNEPIKLRVIAVCGEYAEKFPEYKDGSYSWDHVSVSLSDRTPTWLEMAYIKHAFWDKDEVVMQLHVADVNHVNINDNCLHLWKPLKQEIPLPPLGAV